MKKVQLFLVACAFVIGCGWFGQAVRTTLDIARCLCEVVAGENQTQLGGLTPGQWCEVEQNLDPFIREVTRAKAAAARKAGVTRE